MNDIATTESLKLPDTVKSGLQNIVPEAGPLVANISNALPRLSSDSKAFYKRQSQFMDTMMTVSHPTPYRNLRQILAEMQATLNAIMENSHKLRVAELETIQMEQEPRPENSIAREIFEVKLAKKKYDLARGKEYLTGALKKASNYADLYREICANNGIQELSEADFEDNEEEYHIKKAFEQALCAFRAHGNIDEGNQIYFYQIGINGTAAANDITKLLQKEQRLLDAGTEPSYALIQDFLTEMATKYKGSAAKSCERHGKLTGPNYSAMLESYK